MKRARFPGFAVVSTVCVALWALLFAAHAQERLGGEFQVNTYTTGDQRRPAVAIDADGDFVVVWESFGQDGSEDGVFGQPFTSNGAAAGAEFRANSYTTSLQRSASAAMDVDGNFVVAWRSLGQDGDSYGIFGQRFFPNGLKVGDELQVNTYTTSLQVSPSVAMDAAGNFVIVWQSRNQDGDDDGIRGRRFTSTGDPFDTFQVNTHTTSFQRSPSVAMDAAGNFVAVWYSDGQEGSGLGIFGQQFESNGTPSGSEFPVNSHTTGNQRDPSVAMDDDGNFVVVWHSLGQDGSGYGIFGRRFASSGVAVGGDFQVNTYTTSSQLSPSVAMDGAGNFVVIWHSINGQDGDSDGVFGQRFTSDGSALGGEFQVNTYTSSSQSYPAVALDGVGRFVVVWRSDGQDGEYGGIFGQRFRFGELDFFIGDADEAGDAPPTSGPDERR